MKTLVVGGRGTIGRAVAAALEERGHELLVADRSAPDEKDKEKEKIPKVDLEDPASISAMYDQATGIEAVVCAAGFAPFGSVARLSDADFELALRSKVMGQVNLVRSGLGHVSEGGVFVLTSGDLSQAPVEGSAAMSMAGAAVELFARAAALDLAGRYRVNVVSPAHVAESRLAMGLPAMPGVWAAELAERYVELVEGDETGVVVEVEPGGAV